MTRGKVLRLEGRFMVLNLWTDDPSKYLRGSRKELLAAIQLLCLIRTWLRERAFSSSGKFAVYHCHVHDVIRSEIKPQRSDPGAH